MMVHFSSYQLTNSFMFDITLNDYLPWMLGQKLYEDAVKYIIVNMCTVCILKK